MSFEAVAVSLDYRTNYSLLNFKSSELAFLQRPHCDLLITKPVESESIFEAVVIILTCKNPQYYNQDLGLSFSHALR